MSGHKQDERNPKGGKQQTNNVGNDAEVIKTVFPFGSMHKALHQFLRNVLYNKHFIHALVQPNIYEDPKMSSLISTFMSAAIYGWDNELTPWHLVNLLMFTSPELGKVGERGVICTLMSMSGIQQLITMTHLGPHLMMVSAATAFWSFKCQC